MYFFFEPVHFFGAAAVFAGVKFGVNWCILLFVHCLMTNLGLLVLQFVCLLSFCSHYGDSFTYSFNLTHMQIDPPPQSKLKDRVYLSPMSQENKQQSKHFVFSTFSARNPKSRKLYTQILQSTGHWPESWPLFISGLGPYFILSLLGGEAHC